MELSIKRVNSFFETFPDVLRISRIWVVLVILLLTVLLGAGARHVTIDESLTNYFHQDDPVKKAYDQFRLTFGGDEYVYIVYRAMDGDIFSESSLSALKRLHTELTDYRLKMDAEETSPLDHIDEVKSLINVKYMEAEDQVLFSRNFIGDRMPKTPSERETLRQKALSHPDYPLVYLSNDSQYAGIVIRTDFNARPRSDLSPVSTESGSEFDDDTDPFETEDDEHGHLDKLVDASGSDVPRPNASGLVQTDIKEYPALMEALRDILSQDVYTRHLEFYPVGHPVLMDFFAKAVMDDMGRLMSLVLLLITGVLWLLFRSLAAVFWPIIIIGLTVIWIMGIVGWSGIAMSSMLQIIVFLSISVGVADSVHILSGYLYFRNQQMSHGRALSAVMKKSGLACLLTSITTAAGLMSLTLVPLKPIAVFGAFAAISVLIAFAFTVVLLPIMLDIWNPVPSKTAAQQDHPVLKLIRKIERVSLLRPWQVLSVFTLAGLILVIGLAQLKVDSNFVKIIKKGMPLRQAYTLVDDHMSGTANLEIMLDFRKTEALKDPEVLMAMQDLQVFMEREDNAKILKTQSLVNVVKDTYRVLNEGQPVYYKIPTDASVLKQVLFLFDNANPKDRKRLVTDDYAKARIGISAENVGTVESVKIMARVQDYINTRFESLRSAYPELEVTLTGNVPLLAIMLNYIAWAQIKSFGLALLVISITLFLVLGSFRAGLAALAPNLFPILTAFGLMGYFNIPLDADTLLVAPIIIGLAVDDTIHFMTHFRIEMARTKDLASAVVSAIREAGQAIAFTSLILSAGFLMFILSFHNGISHFGIFAAVAIMTALISDLFLLPALCCVMKIDFNRNK